MTHTTEGDGQSSPPLTPAVFHILLALADQDRHGYGIIREIAQRTGGTVRMGPGTLYGSIKRMLADGLITAVDERANSPDEDRRRYYRLTPTGHRLAVAEAQRLDRLVGIAAAKRLLPSGYPVVARGVP